MKHLLGLALLAAIATRGSLTAPSRVPILVELYTSEGCSSCPPADALLELLQREQPVDGAEIVPLGFHVDYFNNLGWKDGFSSPAFTARQSSYSRVFGDDNLYTPQIVVDGKQAIPGTESARVRQAIAAAVRKPHWPVRVGVSAAGDRVRLTIDVPPTPVTADKIQIFAAITEDGLTSVVNKGENEGRTLHHVAVARRVQVLGVLATKAAALESQLQIDRAWGPKLNAVVWLQGVKSREVYGAAVTSVTR